MDQMNDIKCFQHCDRNHNILCFSVPVICPLCGENVTTTPSRIPPYLIPSPLANAKDSSCSVVIKPTIGTFLKDYKNGADLHVGVTDSLGNTYDYNERGMNIGQPWEQCTVIRMIEQDYNLQYKWDTTLYQMSKTSSWNKFRYDEEKHNCFDFVMTFLQSCDLHRTIPAVMTKHTFCEELVVKHTHKTAAYISLYRKIQHDGLCIQNIKH